MRSRPRRGLWGAVLRTLKYAPPYGIDIFVKQAPRRSGHLSSIETKTNRLSSEMDFLLLIRLRDYIRITLRQSLAALIAYRQIPLKLQEIELSVAMQLSNRLRIYAYDAYVLACSLKNNCPLITLDGSLIGSAKMAGVEVLEVIQ